MKMKKFKINVHTNWCGEDNDFGAIADNELELQDIAQSLAYRLTINSLKTSQSTLILPQRYQRTLQVHVQQWMKYRMLSDILV